MRRVVRKGLRVGYRTQRLGAVLIALVFVTACATGQAIRRGDRAVTAGDWDTAVAFYRQALGKDPTRPDIKIKLERAMQQGAAAHVRRARELEAQEQLPGAVAEYRLAADLDPSSTLALTKALELERKMREQAEAARPPSAIDALRQQAARSSSIPHLDPRTPLPKMQFTNAAVRDILRSIADNTGINIRYDQGLDAALSRPFTFDVQDTSLEEVLLQVLESNQLTFKIQSPRAIFVYQDTPAKRQQYEAQYIQTFYLSNALPEDVQTALNQLLGTVQIAIRPQVTIVKGSNAVSVKATAPVLAIIDRVIQSLDRPAPEVFVEAEILEVDRNFVRQIGLDLNQWAIGMAFSPEVAPDNTAAGTFPPAVPGQYSLGSINHGVNANAFYLTTPSAMIHLLESNKNTRVLARPSQRGQAGKQIKLTLGDQVPIPQTVFQAGAVGGPATIPATSVTYQSVGVNLLFTPRVTYQDEIILDSLTLEKSGVGANLDVGGQTFPTINSRRADTTIRLRDGESTVISGLLRDEEHQDASSFPGLSGIPILRSIFGNTNRSVDQTDIVMIITPHIVRGHELKPGDLQPMYIGTGTNIGAASVPQLISPDAIAAAVSGPSGNSVAGGPGAAGGVLPRPQGTNSELAPLSPSGVPADSSARTPGIVPIQPANNAPSAAPARTSGTRISLAAPGSGDALPAGGGPFTVPIQIADADDVATIALSITYDPAVVTAPTVTQGSFMMQGGVTVTFVPSVSTPGRIDVALSRPTARRGASGAGLLAAISFKAGSAGTSDLTVSGVASTASGQTIPLQFTPARIAVR
jgi:general secretion pathway protein D